MRKQSVKNPRYPYQVRIVRTITKNVPTETTPSDEIIDDDDPFNENTDPSGSEPVVKQEEVVIYEGKGRTYTDTTTNGTKVVDSNKRKASIPVRYDEWEKLPLDGDTLYSTMGNVTEVGTVRDCECGNDNTLVYWDFVRV
jgi:hypothetical protein